MTTNLFFGVEAGLLPKTISFSMISCWRLCFENETAKWSKIQDFCWMIECLGGETKKKMHFKTKVFKSQNPHPLQFLLFLLSIKCCPLICYYVHVMVTINEKCTFMFLLPLANFSFKLLFNLIRYVSSTLIINTFFPSSSCLCLYIG